VTITAVVKVTAWICKLVYDKVNAVAVFVITSYKKLVVIGKGIF
jgi:hypothetical protein